MENDETIKVPLMYSNPERWNSIQKNGYLIDNKKQLIIPLIVFKRNSISKDENLSVDKIDPLNPKLFYTFQSKYSKENRYDNFSVQQGLNKTRQAANSMFGWGDREARGQQAPPTVNVYNRTPDGDVKKDDLKVPTGKK